MDGHTDRQIDKINKQSLETVKTVSGRALNIKPIRHNRLKETIDTWIEELTWVSL